MRVSVVVATYESARYLGEQLTSIMAQSRPVDEIIISDDGSNDGTEAVAREILADFPAFSWLCDGTRRGVVRNVERGLRAAGGDIIMLSDHDDRWRPAKVATAVACFEAEPATLAWFSNAGLIDGAGAALPGSLWERLGFDAALQARWNAGESMSILMRASIVTGATLAINRRLLDTALPLPEQGWHDAWFAQLSAATGIIRAEPTQLIDYRLHGNNAVGLRAVGLKRRWDARPHDFEREWADLSFATSLGHRLAGRGGPSVALVEARAEHLRRRLRLPERRFARIAPVVREWRSGDYLTYSEGWAAALWDLTRERGPVASAPHG